MEALAVGFPVVHTHGLLEHVPPAVESTHCTEPADVLLVVAQFTSALVWVTSDTYGARATEAPNVGDAASASLPRHHPRRRQRRNAKNDTCHPPLLRLPHLPNALPFLPPCERDHRPDVRIQSRGCPRSSTDDKNPPPTWGEIGTAHGGITTLKLEGKALELQLWPRKRRSQRRGDRMTQCARRRGPTGTPPTSGG